jgi:hypothetical protein
MSLGAAAKLPAMYSQLASAIIGSRSLYEPRGNQALAPAQEDDTLILMPANGVTTPALTSNVQINLSKQSTLIGKCWLEVTLTAGTTTPAFNPNLVYNSSTNYPSAELVKNVGDLIVNNHQLVYGNAILQNTPGRFNPLFRRLCCNDVNIEGTNAEVLGGLPPGGNYNTGTERVLVDAYYRGVTLDCPLDELFFASNRDEFWMPESLALEGQLILNLSSLGQIVCTNTFSAAAIVTAPTISNCFLRYCEITVSAAEKENRLKLYKTPQGLVTHFLDLELQVTNATLTGVAARAYQAPLSASPNLVWNVQLNNFRMDMAEIIFCIHRIANTSVNNGGLSPAGGPGGWYAGESGTITSGGYSGSYMESDGTQQSILWPAGTTNNPSFATMISVTNFQILSAGKTLYANPFTDLWNRATVRKLYHRDSQIADPVYCDPIAQFPEDRKNATGHLSASVLGQLYLQINLPDPGPYITYGIEVFSHSHNLMQSRAGGIAKALN